MKTKLFLLFISIHIASLSHGSESVKKGAFTSNERWTDENEIDFNTKRGNFDLGNRNLIQRIAQIYSTPFNKQKTEKNKKTGLVKVPFDSKVQKKVENLNFGTVTFLEPQKSPYAHLTSEMKREITNRTNEIFKINKEIDRLNARIKDPMIDKKTTDSLVNQKMQLKKSLESENNIINYLSQFIKEGSYERGTFYQDQSRGIYGIYAPIDDTEPKDYVTYFVEADALQDNDIKLKDLLAKIKKASFASDSNTQDRKDIAPPSEHSGLPKEP